MPSLLQRLAVLPLAAIAADELLQELATRGARDKVGVPQITRSSWPVRSRASVQQECRLGESLLTCLKPASSLLGAVPAGMRPKCDVCFLVCRRHKSDEV